MNGATDSNNPMSQGGARSYGTSELRWRVISEPGAAIELKVATIPPHIQAAISAGLELGKRENQKTKSLWKIFLERIGL